MQVYHVLLFNANLNLNLSPIFTVGKLCKSIANTQNLKEEKTKMNIHEQWFAKWRKDSKRRAVVNRMLYEDFLNYDPLHSDCFIEN